MFESFLGVNPWTALFTLLNTLLIFFVGRKYLFGPVMAMIRDRQREIDNLYTNAGAAEQSARALEETCRKQLCDAAKTAENILRDATSRAQIRHDAILRQAKDEAAAILSKASSRIEQEKQQAIRDAGNEVSEMALAIAGKVLGRTLNNADHSRLADSFIKELGEAQ